MFKYLSFALGFLIYLVVLGCTGTDGRPGGNSTSDSSISQPSPVSIEETHSQKDTSESKEWRHANFKGINVGIDSRARALEILGSPVVSTTQKENDFDGTYFWDNFGDLDDVNRSVNVVSSIETNIVVMIISTPDDLSVEKAISIFGDDFLKVRYSVRECKDGTGEIFEKHDGELMFIEYPKKGIVLNLDGFNKIVNEIEYRGPNRLSQEPECI